MANILALDLGTTALKLLLLSTEGVVLYTDSIPYPTMLPKAGWVEQDPNEWEKALLSGLKGMQSSISLSSIDAISFSGHMSSMVLVDAAGVPCYPCITLADSRSDKQVEELRIHYSSEIAKSTGNSIQNAFVLPKLLWFMQERSDVFSKAAFWFSAKDYLRFLLTEEIAQDTTDSYNSLCLDAQTLTWNYPLIMDSGLPANIFPKLLFPYEKAGHVTTKAATKFGLREGIEVYAGGADMACATVSMDMKKPGDSTISLGTNAPFMMIIDKHDFSYAEAISYHVGVWKGGMYGLGTHFNAGAAINNFSKLFSPNHTIDYEYIQCLSDTATSILPGCDGVITIPFFAGSGSPYFSSKDRGSVIGLTSSLSQAQLFRSLLEGITLNIRQTTEIFEKLYGGKISKTTVFGGGTNISLWTQIIADVLSVPIQIVPNSSASAIGAAIIGGFGAGMISSTSSMTEKLFSGSKIVNNIRCNSEMYNGIYERYTALYNALKPIYQ